MYLQKMVDSREECEAANQEEYLIQIIPSIIKVSISVKQHF